VIITNAEKKEQRKDDNGRVACAKEQLEKVETEIDQICRVILELVESLIAKATTSESQVFYLKMKADYCRYITEFADGDQKAKATETAHLSYNEAQNVAQEFLPATHPTRLGLALNFSVFQLEILKRKNEACEMARIAFEDSLAELDAAADDSYKDTTLIMSLLRDNLVIWTSDNWH
jgi:14-3-3 protein epsilon